MKVTVLAGILLLLAAPAYADQHLTLPDTMLGTWCVLRLELLMIVPYFTMNVPMILVIAPTQLFL
jgi:hypothetical protein